MWQTDHPEVLIIGAGPVGLFSALALHRQKVRTALIDKGIWPCTHSYALALHPQSMDLMREYGLAERILESAYPVTHLGIYDAGGQRLRTNLTSVTGSGSALAVVRQDALEDLLERTLFDEGLRVSWRHEATRIVPTPDAVELTIDEYEKESRGYIIAHSEWVVARSREFRVPYVIGADGYNSRVRRAAGLDFPETSPAQYYAVFEFETDATLEHEVRLVLGEHTTDVLWPLPGGSCRWSFELPGYHDQAMEELQARLARTKLAGTPSERLKDRMIGDEGSQLPELEESRLQELIRERAPWFTGKVRNLVWKNVIRFERRLAPSFGKGRLWLAGDAAHLAAPAGIQSMNLGLAEAHDLASALARSLRGGAVSDLQQYNNKWLRTWQMLQGQSARLHAGAQADAWLGSRSDALMGCLPAHGDAFIRLAAQLGFELAEAAHR